MLVIWQGPICEELHGMGFNLCENGLAETMTVEGDRHQIVASVTMV